MLTPQNNKISDTVRTKLSSGFTLLVAVLMTSVFLIVSFAVINVAVKQLILANSAEESQHAFYAADSGTECAVYWDLKNTTSAFDPTTPGTISCSGQTISTGSESVPTIPPQSSLIGGGDSNTTSIFSINFTKGCAIVRVTKAPSGITTVDSRGYNTCSNTALRRFERGLTLTFNSGSSNLSDVIWTNPVRVDVSGNSLTKNTPCCWGGAFSVQSISSGNGYVEFSTSENNTFKVAGLSHTDTDQDMATIDYGIDLSSSGHAIVYEKGIYPGPPYPPQPAYSPGDVFRVSIESGVVKYYQNGTLLYTSTAAPVYPLYADSSFYTMSSTITNAKITPN